MALNEIDPYHYDGSFKIGLKEKELHFFVQHFQGVFKEYCVIPNKYPNSYFELQLQTSRRVRAVVECYRNGKVIFFKEWKSWTKKKFKTLNKEAILKEFYYWFILEYGDMLPKPIQVKEYGKPVKFIYPKKKEQG